MQPLTILLGIVLGSAFSIAFSLAVVLLVFALQADTYERLQTEIPELQRATAMFAVLTLAAAWAFFGELRRRPWRGWALVAVAAGTLAIGTYYWPD